MTICIFKQYAVYFCLFLYFTKIWSHTLYFYSTFFFLLLFNILFFISILVEFALVNSFSLPYTICSSFLLFENVSILSSYLNYNFEGMQFSAHTFFFIENCLPFSVFSLCLVLYLLQCISYKHTSLSLWVSVNLKIGISHSFY